MTVTYVPLSFLPSYHHDLPFGDAECEDCCPFFRSPIALVASATESVVCESKNPFSISVTTRYPKRSPCYLSLSFPFAPMPPANRHSFSQIESRFLLFFFFPRHLTTFKRD